MVRAVNEEEDLLDEESIHQQVRIALTVWPASMHDMLQLAMADHELQTMKDTLLIETSQLLGVSVLQCYGAVILLCVGIIVSSGGAIAQSRSVYDVMSHTAVTNIAWHRLVQGAAVRCLDAGSRCHL